MRTNSLQFLKSQKSEPQPRPFLVVSKNLKSIFYDDPYKIVRFRRKLSSSKGLLNQMKGDSAPSFNESGIQASSTTKKSETPNQSNFLDEKLQLVMNALSKKASFEEPTIIHTPAIKMRSDPEEADDYPPDNNFINFLKESINTDANAPLRRKRFDRSQIVWHPKVYDIYEPEFSSDDEKTRPQATNSATKTVAHNFQKKIIMDDRLDSHHIKSVYFDNQGSGQKSDTRRYDDKFTIYSIKLSAKPSVTKQITNPKNVNFTKKTSIYDSIKDQKLVSPYLERDCSPKKKNTMQSRDLPSKASIEKHLRGTPAFTKKPSSQQIKTGHQDSFANYRVENKSISKQIPQHNSVQVFLGPSLRTNSKSRESPTYPKFVFGNKKRDLQFF